MLHALIPIYINTGDIIQGTLSGSSYCQPRDQHEKLGSPKIKMTDLKKKINEKNIIQNLKMVDKILEMTLKSLTEANTNQDILETVFDIKKEVIDLEEIATELSKRIENDTEDTEYNGNEDNEIQIKSNPPIVKCDPCKRMFSNISSLEKHIQRKHTEYDTYECEQC
jgi:hypothetical protein